MGSCQGTLGTAEGDLSISRVVGLLATGSLCPELSTFECLDAIICQRLLPRCTRENVGSLSRQLVKLGFI